MSVNKQNISFNKRLSLESTGQEVRVLQSALNNRPPSDLPILKVDGIFGKKTDARVREYQRNNGLVADGIVGQKTRAALIGEDSVAKTHGCNCSTPEYSSLAQPRQFADFFRNIRLNTGNQFAFGPGGSSSAAAGSGPLRMMDDVQKATAISVYGASLDFSTIFISNKTGIGGRPFTIAFNDGTQIVQIMNCGSFDPDRNTLIHELAHAWQSQHHRNKFRFTVNAVDSQAGAIVASGAAAIDDPVVVLHKDFPTFFPFDAYAYHPSLPFSSLAAEQMAQAIENDERAIVDHVRGVGKNMIDNALMTALSRVGFADHRMRGVK